MLEVQKHGWHLFAGLLGTDNESSPSLLTVLIAASNIAILAPSNDAIGALMNDTATAATITAYPGLIAATLLYHVLKWHTLCLPAAGHTSLYSHNAEGTTYANMTGGQVAEADAGNDSVTFFPGLKLNSFVTEAVC